MLFDNPLLISYIFLTVLLCILCYSFLFVIMGTMSMSIQEAYGFWLAFLGSSKPINRPATSTRAPRDRSYDTTPGLENT